MSHVENLNLEIRNLEAVKRACARLGWVFKENQKTYNWWNMWVDDSPVPRKLFATEAEYQRMLALPRSQRCQEMQQLLGKCDHAIQIPGQAFEIGVVERNGEYLLFWDWASDLRTVLGDPEHLDVNPFPAHYVAENLKMQIEPQGYQVYESWKGNSVTLTTVKY